MSTQTLAVEQLFSDILENLSEKESYIIQNRVGLDGTRQTLQAIGDKYNITRERVRQIEDVSIKKIGRIVKYSELSAVQETAKEILASFGGALSGERIVSEIIKKIGAPTGINKNIFYIILQSDFEIKKSKPQLNTKVYFHLPEISKKLIDAVHDEAKKTLIKKGDVMHESTLYDTIQHNLRADFGEIKTKLIDSVLDIFLDIVKGEETYIELSTWNILNPKTLKEKALYILKKEKKPFHFVELANAISDKFQEPVKVNTIHNELIRNNEFVLIGRGIYVLKDWGYKTGTVLDVVIDILQKSGGPLSADEITKRVLKTRQVKTNTIYMNLQNKQHIKRVGRNVYDLKNR